MRLVKIVPEIVKNLLTKDDSIIAIDHKAITS